MQFYLQGNEGQEPIPSVLRYQQPKIADALEGKTATEGAVLMVDLGYAPFVEPAAEPVGELSPHHRIEILSLGLSDIEADQVTERLRDLFKSLENLFDFRYGNIQLYRRFLLSLGLWAKSM